MHRSLNCLLQWNYQLCSDARNSIIYACVLFFLKIHSIALKWFRTCEVNVLHNADSTHTQNTQQCCKLKSRTNLFHFVFRFDGIFMYSLLYFASTINNNVFICNNNTVHIIKLAFVSFSIQFFFIALSLSLSFSFILCTYI